LEIFLENESLEKVKQQVVKFVASCNHSRSLELLDLLSQGKMLRSKLILKIAGQTKESIKLCAIIEMIQSASLLHDDVIDEADTRRGKPSINALFDNKTSIMFGDILYSKAFSELTLMDKQIAYTVADAVTKLSIGELMDVELANSFNSSYDLYFEMIYNKTASLIEASAKAAALLVQKDPTSFALYGKNLGLAFQMIDDILDITQDSQTLGKPAMLDFVEGKVTIPYLLLYERIDNKEKLKSLYKKELNSDEQLWIKEQMVKYDVLKDSIAQAKQIGLEAIEAIKADQNSDLINIMKQMIDREF
jgi:octaprenyl-diphosphate synthase